MKKLFFALLSLTLGAIALFETTPATSQLLKANGTAAISATPGVDYLSPAITTNQNVANLNKVFYVDGFPSNCIVGIGNYATQADCAWATAYQYVITQAGQNGAKLVFGSGYYPKNIEWIQPSTTNGQAISLEGQGIHSTYLIQTTSTPTVPMLYSPRQSGNYATFDITNMTFSANNNANSCADLGDIISNNFRKLDCVGVIDGSDHMWSFGINGLQAQEVTLEQVVASAGNGWVKTLAQVTATLSGDSPVFTIVNPGSGYPAGDVGAFLLGTGHGDHPCTDMGKTTATVSEGVVTAITSTATGCTGTVYVQVFPVTNIAAGFRLYLSDSTANDLYVQGTRLGIDSEYGAMTFVHAHPTEVPVGIMVANAAQNVFYGTECDTIGQWCFDFEQPNTYTASVDGTFGVTASSAGLPGFATYHLGPTQPPVNVSNSGNLCTVGHIPAGYNGFLGPNGPYDDGQFSSLPVGTTIYGNDLTCGTSMGDVVAKNLSQSISSKWNLRGIVHFGQFGNSTMDSATGLWTQWASIPPDSIDSLTMPIILRHVSCNQANCATNGGSGVLYSATGGSYRYEVSAYCTSAVTNSTVNVSIIYFDPSNTLQTETATTAANCTNLGAASKIHIEAPFQGKAGTAIEYFVTTTGTPNYSVMVNLLQESKS